MKSIDPPLKMLHSLVIYLLRHWCVKDLMQLTNKSKVLQGQSIVVVDS